MADLSSLDKLRDELQAAQDAAAKRTERLSVLSTLASQVGAGALTSVTQARLQIAKGRLEVLRSAVDRINGVGNAMKDLEDTGYPDDPHEPDISQADRDAAAADLENLRVIFGGDDAKQVS